ncbi:hypothetical protein Plhal304r1_c035g0108921 [Plasmopara halstedii]
MLNHEADAAHRVKTIACDIGAIERRYAAGGDGSFIASCTKQVQLYILPCGRYNMVIDIRQKFVITPLQKILSSLASKRH